ncbi:MAG: DALR anticodon-binding domain-containing protein, partial [Vicinamibacteria bacterium]|nr:DALR anticodon-binding domain-containing protein [Vicinamibacteria bacterium]
LLKQALAAAGHAGEAERSVHFSYEMVALSHGTARQLGYSSEAEDAGKPFVEVSGRKGLGVKADDLIDALIAKAQAEIDARDPERDAAARETAAREIATGALRYFLCKFGRTKIITFDMEEALAFVGETGPYIQNAVVRARNIFTKLAAEGHSVEQLLAAARSADLAAFMTGEEGDEVWSLLALMARSDEIAEAVIEAEDVSLIAKHTFAVAQAFHSYYQKPKYSLLYAENEELRALRTLVVAVFLAQMERLTALLGIPIPERM